MKKLLFLMAIMLMPMMSAKVMADDTEVYYLQVYDYSGAATEFALTDEPVIKIADNTLTVTAGSSELSASLEDVKYYKYSVTSTTGIQSVESGVQVNNADANVYTINGIFIGKGVNISSLPKGIYILRAGKQSFKFIKK